MDWVNIAFWVFAIAATVSAGAVISVRNPVHAVLCLVLTFFSIACVWLLVGAEFLGVALVLVYVAVAMLVQMLILIGVKGRAVAPFPADNAAAVAADSSNVTWLARTLFTEYLLPFEFAAVILTVAVVAAVMLTLRRRTGVKSQNPGEQTMVKAGQRLRMVKMGAEAPVVHSNSKPATGEETQP